jgi:hypothetical protein
VELHGAMKRHEIKLVEKFTDAPGGRYRIHGDHSGEQFREELLEPALREYDEVMVDLDGALGLPASFLDEAFGPLSDQYDSGKLKFKLTDNDVAGRILRDCFRKHRMAA